MYNQMHMHHHGKGPHCCPPHVFPTHCDQPHLLPAEQFVRTNYIHMVVPHVQPAHITTVNKHIIDHQYHFPCTESVVDECCENHTLCGMPHDHCNMPHHHQHHGHMQHHQHHCHMQHHMPHHMQHQQHFMGY